MKEQWQTNIANFNTNNANNTNNRTNTNNKTNANKV